MGAERRGAVSLDEANRPAAQAPPPPVAPGSYGSAAIVMLTDGQRTTGVDTLDAAKLAADRGVRVYTVGVGKPEFDPNNVPPPQGTIRRMEAISKAFGK